MYELDVMHTHHEHDDYAEKKEQTASLGKEGGFLRGEG